MRTSRIFGVVLAAATVAASPAALQAQQGMFEIVPHFSSYYATGKLFDLSEGGSKFEAKQAAGPGFGGRFVVNVLPSIGLELDGTYVRSSVVFDLRDTNPELDFGTPTLEATVLLASGRLVYTLPNTNMRLFAGGGVIRRGGEAFEEDENGEGPETNASMIVAGLGVRAPITTSLWIDVVVEGNFYSYDPYDIEAISHRDVQVKIGFPIMFGTRK